LRDPWNRGPYIGCRGGEVANGAGAAHAIGLPPAAMLTKKCGVIIGVSCSQAGGFSPPWYLFVSILVCSGFHRMSFPSPESRHEQNIHQYFRAGRSAFKIPFRSFYAPNGLPDIFSSSAE
jgi:hypothetical protein